jgi:hypothetical protein
MTLTTTTNVSVDGVMQGLGGADEDRRGGFERGGWAIPLVDPDAMAYLDEVYSKATAFLFGRRTYEIFARSWGAFHDPSNSPIAAALNRRPKYVASNILTDPSWAGTTVLQGGCSPRERRLVASPFRPIGPKGGRDTKRRRSTRAACLLSDGQRTHRERTPRISPRTGAAPH